MLKFPLLDHNSCFSGNCKSSKEYFGGDNVHDFVVDPHKLRVEDPVQPYSTTSI